MILRIDFELRLLSLGDDIILFEFELDCDACSNMDVQQLAWDLSWHAIRHIFESICRELLNYQLQRYTLLFCTTKYCLCNVW